MGGKKNGESKSKSLFPDVWWKDSSPMKFGKKKNRNSSNDTNNTSHGSGGDHGNGNDTPNYGSTHSSHEPLTDNGDDEEEEPSFLIDIVPSDFPGECIVDINNHANNIKGGGSGGDGNECIGNHQVDVASDISNHSSSDDGDDDDSSCDGSSSEYYDEDEIEQPHRTLGLIFFDFIRFVAISANVRCVNTQMVPVFLAWGKMEILHVALRIFIALFSALLILVEFPDLFTFLQHGIPNNSSSSSTSSHHPPSPPPPPLYIINWIPRGIFYIFLAIIMFEQAIVVRALNEVRHASTSSRFFGEIFIVVSGWFMLIVGALYILFGLFCIQRIMEGVRKDEKEKWTEYYEKVHTLELEKEEAEEREWLLENGHGGHGEEEEHDDTYFLRGGGRRFWQRCLRWGRRCKRRRLRGGGGLCYQLGCRTVDWRC